MTTYDKRSGQALKEGTTIDYSGVKDPSILKYSDTTGQLLAPAAKSSVIAADGLTTPLNPPAMPPPITSSADGLGTTIGGINESIKNESAALLAERQKAQELKASDLKGTLADIMGANTAIAEAPGNIDRSEEDKARKEADSYTSQIEAEQLANRHAVEKLQKNNPNGLFGGALQDEVDRLSRDSVSKQADLAILQNAAVRKWDTANAIADRQLSLKLEPLKAKLDNLKFFYQNNKEDFNKEDDRLYTEAIKKADIELKKQTELETSIKDIKISLAQSGSASPAIMSALSSIDTSSPDALDQVIKVAGKYMPNANAEFQKVGEVLYRIDKATGKVLNTYGGGSNNPSSPTTVVRTVGGNPVTGYTLNAGDDPYFIAQQNGIDMNTLSKLNPQITDWHNVPVGAVINLPDKESGWLMGKTPKQLEAFNSLNDVDKSNVRQLLNNQALLTDLFASRGVQGSKDRQRTLMLAQQVDPTFNNNTNKNRYDYQKLWDLDNIKGNVGTRTAINTALGHLAELQEKSKKLPQGTIKSFNSVENVLNKDFGDPAVTDFRIALTALGSELARVYTGGVPTETEQAEWRKNLAESFSKNQFKGAFNTTSSLLTSKITGLRYNYKTTMGREWDQSLIDPDKKQALLDAGIDPNSIASENAGGLGVQQATKKASSFFDDPQYGDLFRQTAKQFPTYSTAQILQVLNLIPPQ